MLKQLPLPSGSVRVGDFGTGSGQYALALAKRLGERGAIYAFDPFGPALDRVKSEAGEYHSAFYTLEADLNAHIPIRDNLLNGAVVANTLYGLSDKEKFVSELSRVIAPGGRVLVIDWAGSFKNMGPPASSIMSPGEAARLFSSYGFEVGDMLPAGTHHFAFTGVGTAA